MEVVSALYCLTLSCSACGAVSVLQGQAEGCLERLHSQLELELQEKFFQDKDFNETNGFCNVKQEQFWEWKK